MNFPSMRSVRTRFPQPRIWASILIMSPLLLAPARVCGNDKKDEQPQFRYAGGTETISEGCQGRVELTSETLTFRCPGGSLTAPYASISLLQYRANVSRQVWKMKLDWKVRPAGGGSKRNRYFTVVYKEGGANHAIVLDVAPEAMRPYLAEIDLKAGRRVEVQSHEEYYQ